MKVSLNIVKKFTDVNLSVEDLSAKINAQLGGIDAVVDLNERYKFALIVQIIRCEKHENADKLTVCHIDDGGIANGIPRDDQGLVQIVCGAPNVREGQFVVWLPPGSTVPTSFDDKEPFILSARGLRGVLSNGMLASSRELGLSDDHNGILVINPNESTPYIESIKAGVSFASAYGFDDTIVDIENKMFTHRPDCFGQIGVAREISGILHQRFTSPDWYTSLPDFMSGEGLELNINNTAVSKVPRFLALAIKGVVIQPSPLWLQIELIRLGSKPINNIVDITNYVMLLTGQPLHAYDYDKLRGKSLGTRFAHNGEKITLLNGKSYNLTESDVVIVDGEGPVGLGGIMGGGNSEVSPQTKNIVLECATFDMYAVRKTSMRHGLFTDAVTRFNKGQSPLQNSYVLQFTLQNILDLAGGQVASHLYDDSPLLHDQKAVATDVSYINERLGLDLKIDDIKKLLENVEFKVETGAGKNRQSFKVTPPFWRTDIHIPEDIVEEVGRLYGFDKLPRILPQRSIKPAEKNSYLTLKHSIRKSLSGAGANEVLTYSFVHERTLRYAEQNISQAFKLSNAISPDLQYYRLSILPSLLEKIHPNIKSGHSEFILYEIGKGHNKHNYEKDRLPTESESVEMVYASKKNHDGAAYYGVVRYVSNLFKDLRLEVRIEKIDNETNIPGSEPFDLKRSGVIFVNEKIIGIVGELKPAVRQNFKLPKYVAACSLDISSIYKARQASVSTYRPLTRYPKISQDVSLRVNVDVTYATLHDLLIKSLNKQKEKNSLSFMVTPKSFYQPSGATTKTITFHIDVSSKEKTMTDKYVTEILEKAVRSASAIMPVEKV